MEKLTQQFLREELRGKGYEVFWEPEEEENFLYPEAQTVDFDKTTKIKGVNLSCTEINKKIRGLIKEGYGTITIDDPGSKHALGVGILNRLNLHFNGSLGYFGVGLIDGPNVRISGRVGWACAENMLAGTVVVEKNAGSCFGAALRGGDLVCRGDVGSRTGICQKGGTIIVGGRTGILSGFMMQRGRMIILGDTNENLGDSMYDGVIYVGGEIASLGVDAVRSDLSKQDIDWLMRKLDIYGMKPTGGIENIKKVVSGKQLWNYDNLEPREKKIVL